MNLNQEKEQDILFIHLILPIFPETRFFKIPQTASRKYVGAPSRMNQK